jgi:uncharacterized protein (DUF433 family)
MEEENWRSRITSDPEVMGGEPVIKNTRVSVSVIVGSMADGMTEEEFLEAFPQITSEDIRACLKYAAESAQNDIRYSQAV